MMKKIRGKRFSNYPKKEYAQRNMLRLKWCAGKLDCVVGFLKLFANFKQ
jgi:hypothetical protein